VKTETLPMGVVLTRRSMAQARREVKLPLAVQFLAAWIGAWLGRRQPAVTEGPRAMKAASAPALGGLYILVLCCGLAGCGGRNSSSTSVCGADGGAAPQTREMLYLAGLNQIAAFKIDVSTGALGTPTTVAGPNDAAGIAAGPAANLLFVSDFGGEAVDVFSVNAGDGTLAPTSVAPLPQSTTTTRLPRPDRSVTDPAGKYLYVSDSNSGAVDAFAIGADGSLSLVPGSPFPAGDGPSGVAVDPAGKFVYVSDNYDPMGGISAYAIDSSGALTAVPGSPFSTGNSSAGPGPLAVHPNDKFLYVALSGNVNANHLISAFKIDPATGALGAVAGSPFATGANPNTMALDGAGRFLYTANTQDDTVSAFAVNPTTGTLTPIAGSPFSVSSIGGLAVEASGQYLYVASGSNVSGFAIDPCRGALTALPGSPFTTGLPPSGSSELLTSSASK
jgi:6-phosphogluconolactonase